MVGQKKTAIIGAEYPSTTARSKKASFELGSVQPYHLHRHWVWLFLLWISSSTAFAQTPSADPLHSELSSILQTQAKHWNAGNIEQFMDPIGKMTDCPLLRAVR